MPNQFTASLWGDEGFSAILSMKSLPEIIKISANDTYPPLYNITEHLIFRIFGTSEVAIRGLSFFYFLLVILFTYLIGKHLWDRRTGAIAAILLFINPFFFIYAFEGRMYSILALGITASMYFFLTKRWIPYILAVTWAIYSHHFAAFFIFIQFLWIGKELVVGNWKLVIKAVKAYVVIALLYLPWLIPLYKQVTRVSGGFWLGTPTVKDLFGIIFNYLATANKHTLAVPALVVAFSILAIRNWGQKKKESIFLLTWFLGPIILVWTISQYFQSIFFNRYLLGAIPAIMLLVASNRKKFSQTLIILLVGLYAIMGIRYFTHPVKDPFNELASHVKETKKGDDFLIIGNPGSHQLWETKYYNIPAPIYAPEGSELPFYVGTALMTQEDIISHLPTGKNTPTRVGIIYKGDLESYQLPGYSVGEIKEFGDLKFSWFN